jgi:hypothetical protein
MPPFRGGGMGVYHPRAFSSPCTARELAPARLSLGSMSPTRLFTMVASGQSPLPFHPREVIVAAPTAKAKTLCVAGEVAVVYVPALIHDREPRGSRLVVPLSARIGPVASS